MSNSTYDKLKKSATLVLPAIGTLYFALAQIWNFPNGEQVVGTVAAINVFVGVVLGVSERNYRRSDAGYSGVINVTQEPTAEGGVKKVFDIVLNDDPEDLDKKDEVLFMINSQHPARRVLR